MLIIFDLDDTLIDSSGTVIPTQIKHALKVMVDSGLKVDLDKSYKRLLEINKTSPKGKETIKVFLEEIDALEKFFEIGVNAYYGIKDGFSVEPMEDAKEVLEILRKDHVLVLVSKGLKDFQNKKMKQAGIKPSLFKKIIFTDNYDKTEEYKKILEEIKFDNSNVVVCGDKFKGDLLPGKKLGFKTIQMNWGRALNDKGDSDYFIDKLSELPSIIENL